MFYPIFAIKDKDYGVDDVVLTGYYVFFALFFAGIVFNQKHILHYCGFIKTTWLKTVFYIFCASLAFA